MFAGFCAGIFAGFCVDVVDDDAGMGAILAARTHM